ncbi:MAG: diguanylate cyclase [Gammaproteobacteria bacterium]|nr:diguanylate cyclase [Gammaproteobacteria bacterium]
MFTDENVVPLAPRAQEINSPREAEISASVHDLTARQRLEKSQQWLAMIVESTSEAILAQSLEGKIVSWNPAAECLFGFASAAAIGNPVSILFSANQSEITQSFIERIARGEYLHAHEVECVRRDGRRIFVAFTVSPIKNKNGAMMGASLIARDITERKRAENHLQHLALHDGLTGLPNRILFRERVSQAITEARRHGHQVAVLFIDLDHFKDINDSLGHQIGDRLLQITATRLRRCLREGDGVARVGGDEFVVSLSALTDSNDATLIAGKILETLREPFRVGRDELSISGSIGIGLYPSDGQDVETLLHAADMAMYHAKKTGRRNCQLTPIAPVSAAMSTDHHCKEFLSPKNSSHLTAAASTHWRQSANDLGFVPGINFTEYFNKERNND